MNLSVVMPAHNEEEGVRPTVERLHATLTDANIPFEILVVNDHSVDGTEHVLAAMSRELPGVRYVNNAKPRGFGYAIQTGLEQFRGDAVCIVMADASDDPKDVVAYYRKLEEGYECVFGSRFTRQSRVVDYPRHKLIVNRMANWFINVLFHLGFNDTTNAFKTYRREVIQGVQPILSSHFNITVELPLKAITRGYTYATVPINWYNRATGVSKLKIKEMGSRYLFIVLYVWLERMLSRGDYQRRHELIAAEPVPAELPPASAGPAEPNGLPGELATSAHNTSVGGASVATLAPPGAATAVAELTARAPERDEPAESPDTPQPAPRNAAPHRLWGIVLYSVFLVPLTSLGFITWAIWTRTAQVPHWDEWETAALVQRVVHGTATLGDFLAFHGEHRIVIPRLVDVPLILATHWNRQIEMTFDLTVALGEAALLFAAMRRTLRSTNLALLLVAPLALLLFSFAQYDNWLWPFQITLTTTALGVALCVWALGAGRITWRGLGLGILGALVAALSSLGGTVAFIAFAPVVLLRAGLRKTLVWIACALAILIPYFQGFSRSTATQPGISTMVKFVLMYLGAPVGGPDQSPALLAGSAGVLLLLVSLGLYWYLHRSIDGIEAWLGLGLFVLGVAIMTAFGRGLSDATTSRYQAFSVLWWVVLLTLMALNLKDGLAAARFAAPERRAPARWTLAGATATVLLLITVALAFVSATSVRKLEYAQDSSIQNQACVVNYALATPACLQLFYPNPDTVQHRAAFLKEVHLGIFSGDTSRLTWPAPKYAPSLPLTPYFNAYGPVWWTSVSYTLDLRNGFVAYPALGYVYQQRQPGTQPLYECLTAEGRQFLSIKADCGGQRVLDVQGWLYSSPPAGISVTALYSCYSAASGYVGATDATCGGQTREGLLGYILTTP